MSSSFVGSPPEGQKQVSWLEVEDTVYEKFASGEVPGLTGWKCGSTTLLSMSPFIRQAQRPLRPVAYYFILQSRPAFPSAGDQGRVSVLFACVCCHSFQGKIIVCVSHLSSFTIRSFSLAARASTWTLSKNTFLKGQSQSKSTLIPQCLPLRECSLSGLSCLLPLHSV